jgi:hypothetical protein
VPPDHALHCPWGLARARFIRFRTDNRLAPWLRRGAELLVLDLFPQQAHGALEDGGRVTIRDLSAKERLKLRLERPGPKLGTSRKYLLQRAGTRRAL